MPQTSDLTIIATVARAVEILAAEQGGMTLAAGSEALKTLICIAAVEATGPGTIEQAAKRALRNDSFTAKLPPWQ